MGPDAGERRVWDYWRGAAARGILAGRRQGRRDTLLAALALTPTPIWRRIVRSNLRSAGLDHVRPEVSAWLRERYLVERTTMPVSASAAIRLLYRRRCLWETAKTFSSLAEDHGARLVHFFVDQGVVATVAGLAGRTGWPDSRALLAEVAPELPARPTKPPGLPREPFWKGADTQDFIRDWDGSGVDTSVVDPERLRAAWLRKDSRSGLMLQSAWLASAGLARGVESVYAAVP